MYDCGTKDSYCTYLLAKVDTIHQHYSKKQQASVIFKASAKQLGPLKFDMKDICNVKMLKILKKLFTISDKSLRRTICCSFDNFHNRINA